MLQQSHMQLSLGMGLGLKLDLDSWCYGLTVPADGSAPIQASEEATEGSPRASSTALKRGAREEDLITTAQVTISQPPSSPSVRGIRHCSYVPSTGPSARLWLWLSVDAHSPVIVLWLMRERSLAGMGAGWLRALHMSPNVTGRGRAAVGERAAAELVHADGRDSGVGAECAQRPPGQRTHGARSLTGAPFLCVPSHFQQRIGG